MANNNEYRIGGFSWLPPVIKNLLIINALCFLAAYALHRWVDLNDILGLHYIGSPKFHIYQLITYMFMHGNLSHIFFNMFALWMFGTALENYWHTKRFLTFYMVTGVGAALVQMLVYYLRIRSLSGQLPDGALETIANEGYQLLQQGKNYFNPVMGDLNLLFNTVTVGASGAIFGVLLAFGMIFPNVMIYLYFFIPIKAKYFVIIYGVIELFLGVSNRSGDNVAHFAHLGGMIFGLFLILYWRKKDKEKLRKQQQQYGYNQY